MAVPYVFAPVIQDDRILVDGGLVNNLPFDHLPEGCDITIAVDIAGDTSRPKNKLPGAFNAIFYTYQIMMDAMSRQKLTHFPVDIYIRPPIGDIDILDFHKALSIYEEGHAAKANFRQHLLQKIEQKCSKGLDMGGRTMEQLYQLAGKAEAADKVRKAENERRAAEQKRLEYVKVLESVKSRLQDKLPDCLKNSKAIQNDRESERREK